MIELISLLVAIIHNLIIPVFLVPSLLYLFLFLRTKSQRQIGSKPMLKQVTVRQPQSDIRHLLESRQKPTPKQQISQPFKQPSVSSKVQSHLFALVHGDMQTANRLLENTRKSNPRQTEQWVWEKVIFDLERDRL